jgi:phage terminase large subunit GpA-like protein
LQDVNFRGTVIKSGIQLWPVGVDIAKGIIYNRLNLTLDGDGSTPPGYVHFYIGLNDDYFSQLTAEKLITQYDKNGYPQKKWVVVTEDKRNEAIDCEVYAYAAAIHAGISRMNWDALEQMIRGSMKKAESAQRKTARPVVRSKFLS